MRASLGFAAVVAAAASSPAAAVHQGFNYGATFTTGAAKQQSDFEAEFKTARNLAGAVGNFTSARLYTMVQGGTTNQPISAIPAAINTRTTLLLGLWASGGDAVFANELQALKAAITQYGIDLGGLIAGISVGSEDLYRVTATAAANGETNPGSAPDTLSGYIKQVRDAIANTYLAATPVGHVDTWTSWVNGSNKAVIDACDFLGMDAYPYFQGTMANAIGNNKGLFDDAFAATKAAAGGKAVWVTETGFPVSGKTVNEAVPSTENAETYWDQVGCSLFGSTNTWWYTLRDADTTTPNPSFGIITALSTTPLYNLSCANAGATTTSTSTTDVGASTGTAAGSGKSQGSTASGSTASQETSTGAGSITPNMTMSSFQPGPTIPSLPNSAAVVPWSSIGALAVAMMAMIAI